MATLLSTKTRSATLALVATQPLLVDLLAIELVGPARPAAGAVDFGPHLFDLVQELVAGHLVGEQLDVLADQRVEARPLLARDLASALDGRLIHRQREVHGHIIRAHRNRVKRASGRGWRARRRRRGRSRRA